MDFLSTLIFIFIITMQFYKRKDGRSYLVLHSNEWNRLKRQPSPEKKLTEQKEYVKSLNEKSRAWTQTWPDNKHGVIASYEKKQQKFRENQLAIVNSDKQKQKFKKQNSSLEAIKQARQRIFDESCYGRKLLSAFRESKTLEERDAQVQFLKKLKQEKVIETKKIKIPACCSFDLDKYVEDEKKCRKAIAVKMAQQNKEMQVYEKQKAEEAKVKEVQKQDDLENIQLISEMIAREHEAEEKFKLMEKVAKQQHIHDDKYKEERAKSKEDYYAKIIKVQKEKEELSCKINKVLREAYKSRESAGMKQVYENFIQHQEEKRKSLEKIMEVNSKLGMNRSKQEEREEKDKEIKAREKRLEIAEANKLKARSTKERECNQANKLCSDRQCLIVINKGRIKKNEKDIEEYDEKPTPHFGPCNKLMSALKKRIQQPPSWTGASTAHQEFALNADIMLRDCKYKRPVRKVVDEYIKYNKLDSLDVHNYY